MQSSHIEAGWPVEAILRGCANERVWRLLSARLGPSLSSTLSYIAWQVDEGIREQFCTWQEGFGVGHQLWEMVEQYPLQDSIGGKSVHAKLHREKFVTNFEFSSVVQMVLGTVYPIEVQFIKLTIKEQPEL